ncbi:ABC transporter permease [Catenulispora pinisilvae]|uniref:ABC transporter permease n=1 Tax=Catenulispora pinisilvae TaxID=2705253 RepID=UPI001891870D|nr:FtsX-like permease family protein [Catenulispora pinisilvae]
MSAVRITKGPVWRASRAAVKRRKVQTFVIGLVVALSAMSAVLGLGLLQASTGPFEQAFGQQNGAHAVADLDAAKASGQQLVATAHAAGVTGATGPFQAAQVSLDLGPEVGGPMQMTVVGRPQPQPGDVDRVQLWQGRWPSAPGEIVLDQPAGQTLPAPPGQTVATVSGPGLPALTVVGYAFSVSDTADAWVAPSQMAALHPDHVQMLYRFAKSGTDAEVKAELTRATAGLPAGTLVGFQSWRTTRAEMLAKLESLLPMLIAFGVLAVSVAVLIVLNVVSGAVVSGYKDIGVYKTIGFTPRQVVRVYVATMAVPAVVGTVIGLPIGVVVGEPLMNKAFNALGGTRQISPLVMLGCLIGVPLVVALAAYIPARRAAGMSAIAAISAGSAPKRGRGLKVQRKLAGSRLPRSVSMGLGLPFARPARSALTFAAVLLGVTTVVFANGLARTMTDTSAASDRVGAVAVDVGYDTSQGASAQGDAIGKAIRGVPGVDGVAPQTGDMVGVAGMTTEVNIQYYGGDSALMGFTMVKGHWLAGPDQVVVPARFLNRHHVSLGQVLTVELNGRSATAVVVGETITGGDSMFYADWSTLQQLSPGRQADHFEVHAAAGVDRQALAARLRALAPGWNVGVHSTADPNAELKVFSAVITIILSLVAALGVFNTVLLNTRERRRDLGMLKSVGMTPRQVVAMVMTSMGLLGLLGGIVGLPLGYGLHALIVSMIEHTQGLDLAPSMVHVYTLPLLAWMFLAGVGIAVLGALVPARSAARLSISEVLRSE